jgi:eukaryotic-like serine/threonine-protein kinase
MSDPSEPVIQACSQCGALIDVSDQEPFTLVDCAACGKSTRARRNFDHFEIEEILGAGGMGAVYLALDTSLNRKVALKLLRKEYSLNPTFVQQFKTEAAVTASINHPHVINVYSSGEDHGLLYMAMELVDKGSLDDLITQQGKVSEPQVLEVGLQIAQGLQAALECGLIHRDIKPSNILFCDSKTSKIVDFGLAALMDEAGQVGGDIWGTPYYVAPEKLDGRPEDARSDIYSLGATLFHALAGRPPFEAETASIVALKHIKSQVVSIQAFAPEISSATAYVINKMVHKDPEQRYQSYKDLLDHLQYALNELKEKAKQEARDAHPKTRVVVETDEDQSAMGWLTLGILLAVVGCGVGFYFLRQTSKKTNEGNATPAAEKGLGAPEPRFKAAREELFSGQFTDAFKGLNKLSQEADLPQPLQNWISVYEGLAALLLNERGKADTIFKQIEERGIYSTDPAEKALASFFVETAALLQEKGPVPATLLKKLSTTNHEAIGLLLAGIKNWNLENYETAVPFFTAFVSVKQNAPVVWLGDEQDLRRLKKIGNQRIRDYGEFLSASDALKAASSPEEKRAAIETAKAARERIQQSGKLSKAVEEAIQRTEEALAAYEAEQQAKAAALEAADRKLLSETKQLRSSLIATLRFAEARKAVLAPTFNGEKFRTEQKQLATISEWLIRFKSLLVKDLSVAGYPLAVLRKTGQPLPGNVKRADDLQIFIQSPYGSLPMPWADVSLESVIAMAQSFIRPDLPPDLAADRKWLLGVFQASVGKYNESRLQLGEAAGFRQEYKSALPWFGEGADAKTSE